MPKVTLKLLLSSLCLLGLGCGSKTSSSPAENQETSLILNQVGELYRSYQLIKGKPPTSLKEATTMERGNPAGFAALQKGDVVVNWGAKLPDTGEEAGTVTAAEVLAFEKQVPEHGGYVLLLDRTVKQMTADEFKSAPKAGK